MIENLKERKVPALVARMGTKHFAKSGVVWIDHNYPYQDCPYNSFFLSKANTIKYHSIVSAVLFEGNDDSGPGYDFVAQRPMPWSG